MNRSALFCLSSLLVSGLSAQQNTVAGLDGRLTVIDNLTYYGRRGPAHPNGEIGMAMLNTMCNIGSVNIPWYAPMQPNHPMFGFMVVRIHNDKIEQINEWSFCKHAFLSINVNGACGSCQNPGTGSLMGVNCSDTYGAGNNASRTYLGPPEEIDPWLGEWDPVGSYFDIGDPSQPGYPAPADGTRSLSTSIFDSVDNRVTVQEVDLTTSGASYYYGLQLIHKGEAVTNRDDNLAHRGFNPVYGGSNWSFSNNGESQAYGSILDRWPGATVDVGQNGTDDGRIYVASKVTALGGGSYHYEYAVHNVDSSRAGAALRIPVDASASVTNLSFGDIDADGANDWGMARVGNEVVFTATPSNPLEWNTIYNFGFDADFPPGLSTCEVDAARPGPGAASISIQTEVPGGSTIASFAKFGAGCPGSQMVNVPNCASFNPAAGFLNGTTSADEHVYRIANGLPTTILSFDIFTRSNGGSVTVPAYIYTASGGLPNATPIAQTTMTIGPTAGFYTATFAVPVSVPGSYYIGYDSTAQNVVLSDVSSGSYNLAYTRPTPTSPWTFSVLRPSWSVRCTSQPLFPAPELDATALPLIGTTYDLTLTNGVSSSAAVLVSGLSNTGPGGITLPGAPGCDVLVTPDVLNSALITPVGTASSSITIPNSSNLTGLNVYHQWAVLDVAANSLGVTVSDAGLATIGQ
jgi:hypothetical protein